MIEKLFSRQGLSATALLLFIVVLPFRWYTLPVLGNRSIIWLPMAIAALVAALTFKTTLLVNLPKFILRAKLFHFALVSYILVYCFGTLLSGQSPGDVVTMATIYGQFLLLGAILENISSERLGKTLLFAFPISFLALLIFANAVFLAQGTNLFAEVQKALASGSHRVITNRVVKVIVNASFVANPSADSEGVAGSIRNFFGSYVSLAVFSLLTYYGLARQLSWLALMSVWGTLIASPIVLLVVLMSRSAILAIAVGFAVALSMTILRGLQDRSRVRIGNITIGLAVLAFVSITGLSFMADSQTLQNLADRFSEIGSDVRLVHYQEVYERILQRPWAGYGAAQKAPDGRAVHNFFLGAWFQVGIAGFLVALLVWFGLLIEAGRGIRECWRSHDSRLVNVYFAAALLAGPVLRRLVAGNCGRFLLVELFAVAIFIIAIRRDAFHRLDEEYTISQFLFYTGADEDQPKVVYPRPN